MAPEHEHTAKTDADKVQAIADRAAEQVEAEARREGVEEDVQVDISETPHVEAVQGAGGHPDSRTVGYDTTPLEEAGVSGGQVLGR